MGRRQPDLPARPAVAVDRLRQLLDEQEWVKGAVNYDEDLHFSTFYLRASCAPHTGWLYPGYTCLLALYEGFNEHYFLLKDECLRTATALVHKALGRPEWLPCVVEEIVRLSDRLGRVFDPRTSAERLARLSDGALLALYERHANAQRALYRYARLPEALDRGVSYFSNYLTDHLRQRGLSAAEVGEAFAVLSQPLVPSVLAVEMLEFEGIVAAARASAGSETRAEHGHADASARARMFLSPEVVRRLRAHRDKWKYLPYHGYGRRELATLGQYVERLAVGLRNPGGDGPRMIGRYDDARRARDELLGRLDLDVGHRALFAVYADLGAAKLYRRYAQLRNFYYLDLLLAAIADRAGESEWTVRCMLPEEVAAALRAGRLADDAIRDRAGGCALAIVGDAECVVTGAEAAELGRLVRARVTGPQNGAVLKGVVACRGTVVGPCKVVIRADDHREDFPDGAVIVSESTDPDLVELLKRAGGVLTEQGGVTSHAAIICRELNVPTVIGIDGLLDRVHDGDVVRVDAERGVVTILERAPAADVNGVAPEDLGAKAHNLGVVRALGFAVPEFVALPADRVRQLVQQPDGARLLEAIFLQLSLAPHEKLAVRSSAADEDSTGGSRAGAYRSLLNIDKQHLSSALCEFLRSNEQRNGEDGYRGSVIVQRMIVADYAGVCLTLDPRTGQRNALILEMLAGGNEGVTGGAAVPDRLVVDRLTGDILDEERRCAALEHMDIDLGTMVQQFLTLEARFGKPLDIEWAMAGTKLYILQARPIVGGR